MVSQLVGEAGGRDVPWRDGHALVRALAVAAEGRVSLIDPDGVVRADSEVPAGAVPYTHLTLSTNREG